MTKRKLYFFLYLFILLAFYAAVAFLIPNISLLQYVSILFTTISSAFLYFVPILLPKRGRHYVWMRFRLYLISISYFVINLAICYFFAFEFTMNANFYFVIHTLALFVVCLLTFVASFTPRIKEEEVEDEETEIVEIL
ncbi:MAG: hypothetical protein IKY26_06940 [Erysipelotrichaceae bacterium]|nr:hypothetical protein [Erysipelotrichaceae bacterium]